MDPWRRRVAWKLLAVLAAGISAGLGFWHHRDLAADTANSGDDIPSRRASPAAGTGREGRLEQKLEQLLANQQTMLQKFDAIMEELRIIKVRATIRSGS